MKRLVDLIGALPWPTLLIIAALIGGAPFVPEPHLVEKARWLVEGYPFRAIDWFDILWHAWPLALIAIKLFAVRGRGVSGD